MSVLMFSEFGLKMPIHAPFGCFLEIRPPRWDAVSTKPPIGTSAEHNGSISVLTITLSAPFSEKLP